VGRHLDRRWRRLQGAPRLDDSVPPFSAPSLDDLITALGQQPGGATAMLRWGRPFAELQAGG